MPDYYIYMDGGVKGPFSLAELEHRFNAGEMLWETPVCEAGKEQWGEAAQLFGMRFVPKKESFIGKLTRKLTRQLPQKTGEIMRRMLRHHKGFQGVVVVPKSKLTFTVEPATMRFNVVIPETAAAKLARERLAGGVQEEKKTNRGPILILYNGLRYFFIGIGKFCEQITSKIQQIFTLAFTKF